MLRSLKVSRRLQARPRSPRPESPKMRARLLWRQLRRSSCRPSPSQSRPRAGETSQRRKRLRLPIPRTRRCSSARPRMPSSQSDRPSRSLLRSQMPLLQPNSTCWTCWGSIHLPQTQAPIIARSATPAAVTATTPRFETPSAGGGWAVQLAGARLRVRGAGHPLRVAEQIRQRPRLGVARRAQGRGQRRDYLSRPGRWPFQTRCAQLVHQAEGERRRLLRGEKQLTDLRA